MPRRKKIQEKGDEPMATVTEKNNISDIDDEIIRLEDKIEKRKRYRELKELERRMDIMNGETVTLRYIGATQGRPQVYRKLYTLYDPDTYEKLPMDGTLVMPQEEDVEVRIDVAETILHNMEKHIKMKKDTEGKTIQPWIIRVK